MAIIHHPDFLRIARPRMAAAQPKQNECEPHCLCHAKVVGSRSLPFKVWLHGNKITVQNA